MLIYLSFFALVLRQVLCSSCNVLYQLDDMSYCRMDKPFDAYRYYGCSCSGMAPDKPIDGIDKCCQEHNKCYDGLIISKRCRNSNSPYFCLYKWECFNSELSCHNENKCLQSVCQCDETFINCLAKYPYPTFTRKCQYFDGDPILKILTTPKSAI